MADDIAAVQDRIVELFTNLCGDPDSVELATGADEALHELDGLLATR